jgi:hypothetical protein
MILHYVEHKVKEQNLVNKKGTSSFLKKGRRKDKT